MKTRARKGEPEIVYRGGKPTAVIIDFDDYQEMVALLEDAYDLKTLKKIRSKPLKLKKLGDFLKEYHPGKI